MVGMETHDIHLQTLLANITPTKILCISWQLFFLIRALMGDRQEAKFLAPGPPVHSPRQTGRKPMKTDSDTRIHHLPNIAHGCSQHWPGTSWLPSLLPGNITLAKNTRMGVIFYRNVTLGPTVTPLRQAMQEEKLHGKFHFNPLF